MKVLKEGEALDDDDWGKKKEVKASKLGVGNKQDISLCID